MLIIFIFHMFYGVDIFNGLFSDIDKTILTQIRLPRGFLGILAGGGLSVCGAALQGVFRNNLVEPYTLGVSGGAAVGVALAISLSLNMLLGYFTLILAGFLGAVFVLFLLYYIAIKENRFDIKTLLLIGVMISFMSSSILMLILSVSKTENLHGIIFWMMGSLSDAENMINIWLGIIVLSGLFVFYLMANDLNAIQFGYEKSFTLGVNVENVIRMTVLISSLVTASIVSVTGVIGFVGLVVPHVMRKFFYNDFRILFLASFLGGGAFLLLSDMIASKIIYPIELPVGVVTGILGGALFINIFRKERVKWK
ncbi:iron ABC transporter permease [Deferribacteraceae bacterium V6Fe1]|nr:iron ABC transporter permease [Deferribacteraceae bacterium V6Fe1]